MSRQLQWKGPSAPRAERIPAELWAAHKDELCELYQRMKLDDLMPLMRIRHGFTPSRRQYVSQFEKWHVHKYKPPNDNSPNVEPPPVPKKPASIRDIAMSGRNHLQISTAKNYSTKRQQSRQSLQSSNGSQSSRERPKVPLKKRQKLDNFLLSKDPYADLDKAFESQKASRSTLGQSRVFGSPVHRTFSDLGESSNCSTPTPSLMVEDEKDWVSVDEKSDKMCISNSADSCFYSDWDDFGPWMDQPDSSELIPRRERKVDSTRPIDTFTADEIHDMKLAADSLMSLTFDQESFVLHVLTLKHLKHLPNPPIGKMRSALIACARSAMKPHQVEVARSLLEQALAFSRDKPVDAESFVFRMLLADTFTRLGDYATAKTHTDLAWDSVLASEDIFATLPNDDRSLDLLLYHYLSRGVHCHRSLTIETTFYPEMEVPTTSLETQIQEKVLRRLPGPFEFSFDSLGNSCLRSCLQWCVGELESTARIPGGWRSLSKKHKLTYALWIGLHCHLWQRWQNINSSSRKPQDLLWAEETENLMGIAGAELLTHLCWLIIQNCTLKKSNSDREIVRQVRSGATKLHQLSDKELSCAFMEDFSYLAHVGPGFSEKASKNEQYPYLDLFSWRGYFRGNLSAWEAFKKDARIYAVEFIERTLLINLPEAKDPPSDKEKSSDNEKPLNASTSSLHILAATILPTMASSLHSSEYSALRILRDRINQNVRGAIQDAVMGLPSGAFRRSNTTLPSVNDLSMAMASTLSLTSTLALDRLATVSSSVRDRFGDNRFNDSTHRLL